LRVAIRSTRPEAWSRTTKSERPKVCRRRSTSRVTELCLGSVPSRNARMASSSLAAGIVTTTGLGLAASSSLVGLGVTGTGPPSCECSTNSSAVRVRRALLAAPSEDPAVAPLDDEAPVTATGTPCRCAGLLLGLPRVLGPRSSREVTTLSSSRLSSILLRTASTGDGGHAAETTRGSLNCARAERISSWWCAMSRSWIPMRSSSSNTPVPPPLCLARFAVSSSIADRSRSCCRTLSAMIASSSSRRTFCRSTFLSAGSRFASLSRSKVRPRRSSRDCGRKVAHARARGGCLIAIFLFFYV
jgi:hypothetical protein